MRALAMVINPAALSATNLHSNPEAFVKLLV
jgi:hypothetical protein